MIVSVAMLVAMFPMIVHADDEPGSFTELQALFATPGYVVLDKDYVAQPGEDPISISSSYAGINLAGHTIDRNGEEGSVFILESSASYVQLEGAGKITGGNAVNGGALYINPGATLEISSSFSGSIEQNTASANGGAIYNAGNLTIYSGAITKNEADSNGGGIYNCGSLDLRSVTVSGNTVGGKGKGIYQDSTGSISMKESPKVDELYLTSDQTITVSGAMSVPDAPSICVMKEGSLPVAVTSGFANWNANATPDKIFKAPAGYFISKDANEREAQLNSVNASEDDPAFAGNSLTINKSIGLNFYYDLGKFSASELAGSYVTFTIPGKNGEKDRRVGISDLTTTDPKTGHTLYGFTCDLTSIQMAAKVNAVFTYTDGEETKTVSLDEPISIEDYLHAIHAKPSDYQDSQKVAAAVLNYGYHVQEYLHSANEWDYTDDETGYAKMSVDYVTDVTDFSPALLSISPDYAAKRGTFEGSMSYKLGLGSLISIEVTFKTDDVSFKAYCGESESYRAGTDANTGKLIYKIKIKDISPREIDKKYSIKDGEDNVLVTVSPLGYVYTTLSSDNETEKYMLRKKAMNALFWYWYQTTH